MSSYIFIMFASSVIYSALLMSLTNCTPINRAITYQQATDCNGTECYNDLDYYEKNITVNTNIPDNVSGVILDFLPEMIERQEQQITAVNSQVEAQTQFMQNMTQDMTTIMENMSRLLGTQLFILNEILPPKDCHQISVRGMSHGNGVYTILPRRDARIIQVYCDMETDDGPWIVFQKRLDGSVDFYQSWHRYESGFGNADGEYWLGLKNIYILTLTGKWQLRVDLETFHGDVYYALYDSFSVDDGPTNYRLHVSGYSGTAGDALSDIDGRPFSTRGRDNDGTRNLHCAEDQQGAWWFDSCNPVRAHLNGLYVGPPGSRVQGISWDEMHQLKRAEMKMRRIS